MFGRMISVGARSNLNKSMVKLHNAQFGSPVHREAIPKIVLEKTGKPATQKFIDGATKTFGVWWLGTLEQIKRGQ